MSQPMDVDAGKLSTISRKYRASEHYGPVDAAQSIQGIPQADNNPPKSVPTDFYLHELLACGWDHTNRHWCDLVWTNLCEHLHAFDGDDLTCQGKNKKHRKEPAYTLVLKRKSAAVEPPSSEGTSDASPETSSNFAAGASSDSNSDDEQVMSHFMEQ